MFSLYGSFSEPGKINTDTKTACEVRQISSEGCLCKTNLTPKPTTHLMHPRLTLAKPCFLPAPSSHRALTTLPLWRSLQKPFKPSNLFWFGSGRVSRHLIRLTYRERARLHNSQCSSTFLRIAAKGHRSRRKTPAHREQDLKVRNTPEP